MSPAATLCTLWLAIVVAGCERVREAPAAEVTIAAQRAPRPAAVTSLAAAEHRQKGGGAAQVWALARGDNAFVGKLELAAGGVVPEHRDPTEEYIHILSGGGEFTIDGSVYEVGPGTTIYMPPGALVSFRNGPEVLVAIQVFAGPEPAAKYEAWQRVAGSP